MRLDDRDELGPRARAAREPDPEVELRCGQRDVVDVRMAVSASIAVVG